MPKRRRRNQAPEVSEDEVAVARQLLDVAGHGTLAVGGPVRCPDCTGWGLAGDFDPAHRRFDYDCPSCRTTWTLSHAAVARARVAEAPAAPAAPEVDLAPSVPWVGSLDRTEAEAEAPVVKISWGEGPATSGGGWAPRPAG